jgi:hypothetical protein
MSAHNQTIDPKDFILAEKYSKEALDDINVKRDHAVAYLYETYGLAETVRLTRWSHQACLNFKLRHESRDRKAKRTA